MTPQVNPLAAVDALVGRLVGWVRRVGEAKVAYGVLVLAFVLMAALILVWGGGQTFIQDEWSYLILRRGWALETLLVPQNGHLVAVPLLLYKLLFAVFGADSHLPFQVTTVVLHLIIATLFFLLVRRRLPLTVAVAVTLLLVFFGAGWDTLMGAYEIPNLTGMAAGLGMLLALEKRSRGADLAACGLLAVSLASFSVGIAFAAGALLSIWLGGRGQWRRAWVVVAPFALYLVWFLWARKFHQAEVTSVAISAMFSGIADQVASICSGITGLFRVPGSTDLPVVLEHRADWGYPLALVFAGLVVLHVRRAPRSIYFWTVAGTLLVYLALVSVGLSPARTPNSGRYVYMGAILALLLVAELAREIRWSTALGLVAFVLFGLALMANVAVLRAGGRLFEAEGETNRATLAALGLSRARVDPGFFVEDESTVHSHPDMLFPAFAYFEAIDEFGSPAFDLDELVATGEQAREAADQELVRALEIAPRSTSHPKIDQRGASSKPLAATAGTTSPVGACLVLVPKRGRTGSFQIELPKGGFSYRTDPRAEVEVKLARFGELLVTELPPATGSAEVAIPTDASDFPWRAELDTPAKTIICPR